MDFGGIIKRSWQLSWQYRSLWVLGFFAGAGFGGWGGSGYRADRTSGRQTVTWQSMSDELASAGAYLREWAPVIIAAAVLAFLLALAWAALSIAAQGGLAHEIDQAESGGPVSGRAGWSFGFHYWGRVAVVSLVLMLPILVLTLLVAAVAAAGIYAAVSGSVFGVTGVLAGLAALAVVLFPVLLVLGFVLGTMYQLAIRYAVLEDRAALDAVNASWGALRHRFKDVALMWLVMLAVGIGFGIVIAVPAGILGAGAYLMAWIGLWPVAGALGFLIAIVAVVFGAFVGTFSSAAWTLFFRRLTGRDAAVAYAPAPEYPGAPGQP